MADVFDNLMEVDSPMSEVSKKTKSFFDGYACQFDDIYIIQNQRGVQGWLNRYLRASMLLRYERTFLCLGTMEGRTVLDVGSGSGRYILKCLDLGATRVTGIDLSNEMIGLTKKMLASVGAPLHAVDLIVGDFLEHTFQDQYDYAIVMGVMDYVEDAPRLLGKLNKLVSCRAVISFPVRESIWSLQRAIRYGLRGCPLYFYSRPQLKMLMQSSGFKSFTVERIYRDYFVVAET